MPFRRAHEVVGKMVRSLLAQGRDFSDLTLEEWRAASEVFGPDAPQAATALASVKARKTPQSTNPEAVQAAVRDTGGLGVGPLGTWELTLLDCRHPRSFQLSHL